MTTVTSRTLPLVPLQLNMGSMGATDAMLHQDGRMLHNHVISGSNGRLQADTHRLTLPKEERVSPQGQYGSEPSFKNAMICDIDRMTDVRKVGPGADDMSDARSSSVSSYMADSFNKEHDDDQMSYCSDESELSVGKEVGSEHDRLNERTKGLEEYESDGLDKLCGARMADRILVCPSDELSSDPVRYVNKIPSIIRPSPTRLQEEFLRKSQMYAEELMKHQMNFMAATRGLNMSPKNNDHSFGYPVRPDTVSPIRTGDEHRSGFRPHIRASADMEKKWSTIEDRSSQSPEGTNFRGIHSHLNAISKITSALGRDMASLTSPGFTSRESSQSPSNNIHQILNNNINDSNLKFSIDNILKPGFGAGRRITDPLLKRNKTTRKNVQRSVAAAARDKHVTPMDLTAAPTTTATMANAPTSPASSTIEQDKVTSTSSATSSGAGASSGSGGPMVWPAWVYCTRYSDRPSSGSVHFSSFFLFNSQCYALISGYLFCKLGFVLLFYSD